MRQYFSSIFTSCLPIAMAVIVSSDASVASGQQDSESRERVPVYSVNRTPEDPFSTARAVQVVTAQDIWRRNSRTLPELLMEEAGIFVQQTNYGGGSPIIRGLIGKEILIMVDGVRLNNSTYRFGPVQYLATIDVSSIDRIEIVRGADAVLSGTALGGVINIITRQGPGRQTPLSGRLQSRVSTADDGVSGRFEVSGRNDRFRYLLGGTHRSSNDVDGGGDVGTQAATGYRDFAVNFSFDHYLNSDSTLSFRYLLTQQSDVPRTDRIASGTNRSFDFDPQRLQLASLELNDLTFRSWSDSARFVFSWNQQVEGRREIRESAPSIQRYLDDAQSTFSFSMEFGKNIARQHRIVYGLEWSTESIDSERIDTDLNTGQVSFSRGRFVDDSSYRVLGVFLQDRMEIGERFIVTLGSRFSRFESEGKEDSVVGALDIQGSDSELTGSVTSLYKMTDRSSVFASVTRAFRGANLDDVSAFDRRNEGIEVPNPDLSPEFMTTYEVGFKYDSGRFSGSATAYSSRLNNLIERTTGQFRGLDFFDFDGDGIWDSNEPIVLQKKNTGEATIKGFEIDFNLRLHSRLRFVGNYTYTRGEDERSGAPLSRIPPEYATTKLVWSAAGERRPWVELVYQIAGSQKRLSQLDIRDFRVGPEGTPGFGVAHLRGGVTVRQGVRLAVGIENLFDEIYKYHASGIFRPGRQLTFGGELSF